MSLFSYSDLSQIDNELITNNEMRDDNNKWCVTPSVKWEWNHIKRAHAEKLTETTLHAYFLQMKNITHITNTMKKMIRLFPRGGIMGASAGSGLWAITLRGNNVVLTVNMFLAGEKALTA